MVTLLDVSAVAGHHAMPAALLLRSDVVSKWLCDSALYSHREWLDTKARVGVICFCQKLF